MGSIVEMTGQGPVRQPSRVCRVVYIIDDSSDLSTMHLWISTWPRFSPLDTARTFQARAMANSRVPPCLRAYLADLPHISRLRRRPDSRDRPAAACSPSLPSGTCATRWRSAWALCPCLTRVDAPRGRPCLGVDPIQSSHTSLLPAVCWGLSAVGSPCGCAGCRPRRTTRKQSPPARAAVAAARPRRRSVCTFQPLHTSLCTWWELAQQRRGAGRGGGGHLQAQYGALDAMRWPDGGICHTVGHAAPLETVEHRSSWERRAAEKDAGGTQQTKPAGRRKRQEGGSRPEVALRCGGLARRPIAPETGLRWLLLPPGPSAEGRGRIGGRCRFGPAR